MKKLLLLAAVLFSLSQLSIAQSINSTNLYIVNGTNYTIEEIHEKVEGTFQVIVSHKTNFIQPFFSEQLAEIERRRDATKIVEWLYTENCIIRIFPYSQINNPSFEKVTDANLHVYMNGEPVKLNQSYYE